MRDGKAIYAAVLLLIAVSVSYLFVLAVRTPMTAPRLLLAISGLTVLAGTLLLYRNKRYRLLWVAALFFYTSVAWYGYDILFAGDTELSIWAIAALFLGVIGGGLALVREKPIAQKG